MPPWTLNDETRDALQELLNIGIGRAAASLSELVEKRIALSVPTIHIRRASDGSPALIGDLSQPGTVINQNFDGKIHGRAALCFPADSGLALARLLSGDIGNSIDGLDAELSGILLEVGNIVLNGVMGSISNSLAANLHYGMPEIQSANRQGDKSLLDAERFEDALVGDVRFCISDQRIEGSIVLAFTVDSIAHLLETLLSPELV
jgi:chemotaxis protein CheC